MRAPDPGLCRVCRNSRTVVSGKGSSFMLCELSRVDPAFPRYPPLPVVRCSGFVPIDVTEPGPEGATPESDPNPGAS